MSLLTKLDAIKIIATKTGQSQSDVKKTVEALLTEIKSALEAGSRIEFRGFGVWHVKMSSPRKGRNFYSNFEPIEIPAKRTIKFKPGAEIKARLNS